MNTTTTTKPISPFSTSHQWSLHWMRIPSNQKPFIADLQSKKEKKALEAIASVGVIGGLQLSRLFNIDKKQLSKMVAQKKLIRHEIHKNKQIIPLYTIGPTSSPHIMPHYIPNYWVEYRNEDVLKRLLFFQLYELFPEGSVWIDPSPNPFIGSLLVKETLFFVYVNRGKVEDLLMFLKYQPFKERLMIITENLEELKPLNLYVKDLKVRATTDSEIKKGLQNAFYLPTINKTSGIIDWTLELEIRKRTVQGEVPK